jgi:hypothetical protein
MEYSGRPLPDQARAQAGVLKCEIMFDPCQVPNSLVPVAKMPSAILPGGVKCQDAKSQKPKE